MIARGTIEIHRPGQAVMINSGLFGMDDRLAHTTILGMGELRVCCERAIFMHETVEPLFAFQTLAGTKRIESKLNKIVETSVRKWFL